MTTWYQNIMPRIKDISPYINDLFKELKNSENIKSIYIWGSYSKNINKSNFRVKDVDVIARTGLYSDDLISINDNIINELCTDNYLEKQGYDPLTVKFSKNFINIKKYNIDHWAISVDRKLLHWGPIIENKKESDLLNKEIEKYVTKITKFSRKKINRASKNKRKNWYELYSSYINKNFENMPTGWYLVEDMRIKDILKDTIKL